MIEVEVLGAGLAPGVPAREEIQRLCELAAARWGIDRAHVAIEFVDAQRIAHLNAEHRARQGPTDVLSFPIDGIGPIAGTGAPGSDVPPAQELQTPPRELGDVIICPECTVDVREAIVHGMLHLLGMDHEHDDGEMLALQDELLTGAGG